MTDAREPFGMVRRVDGPGGLPAVELSLPNGARAVVCLHGAHVVSYVPAAGAEDVLYLSPRSEFRPGVAIRGGVPVIFPQFADRGPLPKHGFARTRAWELLRTEEPDAFSADVKATFALTDDAETRAMWPHAFRVVLLVGLAPNALRLQCWVENTGAQPFRFTAALHTYLRVQDVHNLRVEGLDGLRYIDSAGGGTEHVEETAAVTFPGEVDRVYKGATQPLRVAGPGVGSGRELHVYSGFGDVVVWNPGPAKAAALRDLGADEYGRMLCIEAARVADPVELPPGGSWGGSQIIWPG